MGVSHAVWDDTISGLSTHTRRSAYPISPASRNSVLPLNLRVSRWDDADEHKRLFAGIFQLMLLMGRYEDGRPALNRSPFTSIPNNSSPFMDEDFVLPFMGMPGSVSTRGQFEYPHAEILRPVCLTNGNPAGCPFHLISRENLSFDIRIVYDFHCCLSCTARRLDEYSPGSHHWLKSPDMPPWRSMVLAFIYHPPPSFSEGVSEETEL